MTLRLVRDSLATRLVAALLVGGALLSIGVAAIEWGRSRGVLAMEVSQRAALAVGNVRSIVRAELMDGREASLSEALAGFARTDLLRALRVTGPNGEAATLGAWPADESGDGWPVWSLSDHPVLAGDEVGISGLTLARSTLSVDGRAYLIEALIDGQRSAGGVWRRMWEGVAWVWVLIGGVLLVLVVMLRRWVERPMNELTRLVSMDAGAADFERWATVQSGELGTLAEAMGRMLDRVESARATLDRRERESDSLFRQAPVAMLSVTAEGVVTHANRRSAAMFGEPEPEPLIGRRVDELVAEEDLPRLWATVERAGYRGGQRVEMRLTAGCRRDTDTARWAVVESTPIHDAAEAVVGLRLCFVDVSDAVRLRGELERQTRLLNLLIDHMSDALLLVDSEGRVAAANQQLAALLGRPASSLLDRVYDAATTWESLGPVDERAFVDRLTQMDADTTKPVQARFETRAGAFVFRGVTVQGDEGRVLGRLWVVQETTPQEQGQRMLIEQNRRLAAMRRIATELSSVWRFEDVTARAVELLREELGIDAVGIAVRRGETGRRCCQLIHRGPAPMGLAEYVALRDFVEQRLLPRTMNGSHTLHWAELNGGSDYGQAFGGVGLTTAAACALSGSAHVVGVVWAGERGREGLERHQLLMLETIAPLIAARLEVAGQTDRLDALALLDTSTNLFNRDAVDRLGDRLRADARPWALVRLDVEPGNDPVGCEEIDWAGFVSAVSRVTRRSTTLARFDVNTVVLVLADALDGDAAATAERVARGLADWQAVSGRGVRVGWGLAPDDGGTTEALAAAAARRAEVSLASRAAA